MLVLTSLAFEKVWYITFVIEKNSFFSTKAGHTGNDQFDSVLNNISQNYL